MKRILACLIALLMTATLCACSANTSLPQDSAGDTDTNTTINTSPSPTNVADGQTPSDNSAGSSQEKEPGAQLTADDLVGPWYLDNKNNDLSKFADKFPGYEEWGSTMEIRSDGRISWYIGAIGGSGTYTLNEDQLTAELKQATKNETSEPQDWTVNFKIITINEAYALEMKYGDTTVIWSHGEETDNSGMAEDWKADFEASLLDGYGVSPDRYEHLGNGIYQVYVTINGTSVPYVTVDSATGNYHG